MPTIVFNSSTGTDTAASGSQGSISASGTSASFSGSVVTLDGSPDLSGFDANEDILWLQTSTGRQFFDLSSVDDGADTVTCVDAPAGTASGLTWGIGGKRSTFDNSDSRNVFGDYKPSWVVETETDQSLSNGALGLSGVSSSDAATPFTIRGSAGAIRTITQTTDANTFDCSTAAASDSLVWENLKLENSAGTKTNAFGIRCNHGNRSSFATWTLKNCELGDATNTLNGGITCAAALARIASLIMIGCYVHDCDNDGVNIVGNIMNGVARIINSVFTDNGGLGFILGDSSVGGGIHNCIFARNTSHGLQMGTNSLNATGGVDPMIIMDSTFDNNGGAGWNMTVAGSGTFVILTSNIFSNNGTYGIAGTGTGFTTVTPKLYDSNCFYNNTSGAVEESDLGTGDNSTTSDPQFTDAANDDFSIGTNLKEAGYPSDIGNLGTTTSYQDIGAVQRQEPAGGGGGLLRHPGMQGGMNG